MKNIYKRRQTRKTLNWFLKTSSCQPRAFMLLNASSACGLLIHSLPLVEREFVNCIHLSLMPLIISNCSCLNS